MDDKRDIKSLGDMSEINKHAEIHGLSADAIARPSYTHDPDVPGSDTYLQPGEQLGPDNETVIGPGPDFIKSAGLPANQIQWDPADWEQDPVTREWHKKGEVPTENRWEPKDGYVYREEDDHEIDLEDLKRDSQLPNKAHAASYAMMRYKDMEAQHGLPKLPGNEGLVVAVDPEAIINGVLARNLGLKWSEWSVEDQNIYVDAVRDQRERRKREERQQRDAELVKRHPFLGWNVADDDPLMFGAACRECEARALLDEKPGLSKKLRKCGAALLAMALVYVAIGIAVGYAIWGI